MAWKFGMTGLSIFFSSRRGMVKSSRGIKIFWCYSRRLLLRWGGGVEVEVKGLGKHTKNVYYLILSGHFYGSEIWHGDEIFWGLNFGLGILGVLIFAPIQSPLSL